MYKHIKPLWLTVLIMLAAFTGTVCSSEFIVTQGWLMSKKCFESGKSPCPLEEYNGDDLVVVTFGNIAYGLEKRGVDDWKLQKAYGQLIGVKGLKEDKRIMVTNIVQITGDKKLTKA